MGVGLYLTGTFPIEGRHKGHKAENWLEEVAAWLEIKETEPLILCHQGKNNEEQPALFVQIHPCAEDVEITVSEPGRVYVAAKTSTVGPGYHIFLCQILHRFGEEFEIDWEDPDEELGTGDDTNYFFHQDGDAVREEMLKWLRDLAVVVLERLETEDNLMIAMPIGHFYSHQGPVITPLGPRSTEWFKEVVEDTEQGIDFFPWWDEGFQAPFFLGRALARMWQDVRWRLPLNEDEGELLMDVHLDLERAYRRDPSLPLPWREWRELAGYLGDFFGQAQFLEGDDLSSVIDEHADRTARKALIGYRRLPVQVTLTGGWSIEIPGEMAEQWEDTGENWNAGSGGRTIWFSAMNFKRKDDTLPTADEILEDVNLPDGELIEHQTEQIRGKAAFVPYEEDGRKLWHLQAHSAVSGGIALCNIFMENPADRDWAVGVWKTLDHAGEEDASPL